MRRNFRRLKIRAGIFLLSAFVCQSISAQTKTPDNVLANFEKSIAQGKIDTVEKPLLAYAVAHPNDSKPLELLAQIRVRQGRLNEARGLYQRVLAIAPDSTSAKINLGKIYFRLGQKDDAGQILRQIKVDSSLPPKTRLDVAAGLISVGEFESSAQILETLPPILKNGDALPLFAVLDLESGNRQRLINRVPLMKKLAANTSLTMQNAEILQSGGLLAEATDLLHAALLTAPNNADLLTRLGRLEINAQNFALAQQHLNKAIKLSPNSAEILSAQALLESAQGKLPAAFDLLSKARTAAPDSPPVLKDFIVVAIRSGRNRQAVEAAQMLISVAPDDTEAQYLLGAAQLQNGNIPEAQIILTQFVQQRPNDSRGCLALGLTFAAQPERFEEARQQLKKCLAFDPSNYQAKYQLALSYKAQGDSQAAIPLLEDVVNQQPNYAPALRDLGALYLQTSNETKAQTLLEKAVTLDPNNAETHFQLSRLYNLTGNTALAKQHLEIFQKLKNGGTVSP